jgi:ADP-ribose pyrophosphatase YjhB (NUDIX family)
MLAARQMKPGFPMAGIRRTLSAASPKGYPTVGVAVSIFPRVVGTKQLDIARILLIQRGNNPGKGLWCFPGGRQERGETIAECAEREALEETGLRVTVHNRDIPGFAATDAIDYDENGDVRFHYGIIHVLAHVDSELDQDGHIILPKAVRGDDAADVKWIRTRVHQFVVHPPRECSALGAADDNIALRELARTGAVVNFVPEVVTLAGAICLAREIPVLQ